MGILPDYMVRGVKIVPFAEGVKRPGQISYGLSSYGYDIRAGYVFKVFSNVYGSIVDPKAFDPKGFVTVDVTPKLHEIAPLGTIYTCAKCRHPIANPKCESQCEKPKLDHVLIPPNSFALAESVEEIEVPRDCLALVIGKSTYARCGIVLNCTPLEPEWRGKITLEISNTTPLPAKVYAGEGIGQVLFFRTDYEPCEVSYADKKGKYQDQVGLELPKVD